MTNTATDRFLLLLIWKPAAVRTYSGKPSGLTLVKSSRFFPVDLIILADTLKFCVYITGTFPFFFTSFIFDLHKCIFRWKTNKKILMERFSSKIFLLIFHLKIRLSRSKPEVLCKNAVLKKLAKVIEKLLWQSLF